MLGHLLGIILLLNPAGAQTTTDMSAGARGGLVWIVLMVARWLCSASP